MDIYCNSNPFQGWYSFLPVLQEVQETSDSDFCSATDISCLPLTLQPIDLYEMLFLWDRDPEELHEGDLLH